MIVGIDAEAASERALDWVIRRARRAPLHVTLVTATDSLLDDAVAVRSRQTMLAGRFGAAHPDSLVDTAVVEASVHRGLREASEHADLLVIGAHRTRPVRSRATGSIGELVAARAHCPTVIVPDDWTSRDGVVVVGVGPDLTSDPAAAFALREAERRHGELRLVHAWAATEGADPIERGHEQAAHRDHLQTTSRRLRADRPLAPISEVLARADAVDALLADSGTSELIVIGTHHLEPTAALLRHAVGSRVLRRSPVPVCVVPEPEAGHRVDTSVGRRNWPAGIGPLRCRGPRTARRRERVTRSRARDPRPG